MRATLSEDRFSYVSPADKRFVSAFDDELRQLGYAHLEPVGSGYSWGRYMIIYAKACAKTKRIVAR